MNYVMCEYIGTYGYSSKSVALRFMVKSFYGVGNSAINNKPCNNIDDGSLTLLREVKLLIKFNYYDCICIEL